MPTWEILKIERFPNLSAIFRKINPQEVARKLDFSKEA
jgi:hypothetical protein